MEESSESSTDNPQPTKTVPPCCTPKIPVPVAEFLVNTVANTAKMVQAAVEAQKSAQVSPRCLGGP